MDIKKVKAAYASQKSQAKKRGIEWLLTFEQWVAWWGDDLEHRGVGRDRLQMQRYGDKGPYALGNIKKGVPAQNSATWSRTCANRKAERARREHQKFLDSLMLAESREPDEDDMDEEFHLQNMSIPSTQSEYNRVFAADKK